MFGTPDLLEQIDLNISVVEETLQKYRALSSSSARAGVPQTCSPHEHPPTASNHALQNTLYPVELALFEPVGQKPNRQTINNNNAQLAILSTVKRSRSSSPCPRYGDSNCHFFDHKLDDWEQRHNDFCLAAQCAKRDLDRREYAWRQQCDLLQNQLNVLQDNATKVREPSPLAQRSHAFQRQTKPAKILNTFVSRRISYSPRPVASARGISYSPTQIASTVASGAPQRARSLDERSSCPIVASTRAIALVAREPTCFSTPQHPRPRMHSPSIRLLSGKSMGSPSSICCPAFEVKLSAANVYSQRMQSPTAYSPSQLVSSAVSGIGETSHTEGFLSAKSGETILCGQEQYSSTPCFDSDINILPSKHIHDDIIKDTLVAVNSVNPSTFDMATEEPVDPISEQSLGVSIPPTPVLNERAFTSPDLVANIKCPNNEQQDLSVRIASLQNAIAALTDHLMDSKCQQKKVEDAIMEINEQVQALHNRIENDGSEDVVSRECESSFD